VIPEVGMMAPTFTAITDADEVLSLKSLRGRPVVLFFYPKDDTATCTVEACSIRDELPRIESASAVVLGISPDSAASHRKFKAKFDLPYTLLADEDHAIAEQFGVWGEKSMYGRTYMGVRRTTFVIDATGRIAKVFEKVKSKNHGAELSAAVAALK
jgi:thioredoxin-dependent peroxiredoxin